MALPQIQQDFRDQDTIEFLSSFKNKGTGKYNIKNLSYPENLGNNPDVQHYVAFFVNVRGKSKFNKQVGVNGGNQKILEDVKVGVGQNRLDPNKTGQQTGAAGLVAGAQIGGAASLLSGVLEGKLSFTELLSAGAKALVGGAAGLYGAQKGVETVKQNIKNAKKVARAKVPKKR